LQQMFSIPVLCASPLGKNLWENSKSTNISLYWTHRSTMQLEAEKRSRGQSKAKLTLG
ncbi:hypothetical protein KUCAC02_015105, partial [Chaenocephalus aceratus]